jgi:virulence-associated protein VagC
MLENALLDFGKEFFEKATEKVKEAADNSIYFEMPEITFVRRRTHEEEEECQRIIKTWRRENCFRKLELLDLLGETFAGDYNSAAMQIRIAKENDKNNAAEFELEKEPITHELMHSIRHQAIGCREPVKNNSEPLSYGIPVEVCEFFSQLNAPACHSLEIKIKKKDYPSLSDVSHGKENGWKPHTILQEITNLREMYLKSKSIFKFRERKELFEKAKKLEDAEKYLYFALRLPEEFALNAKYMAKVMLFSKHLIINPWQREDNRYVNEYFEELMDEKKMEEWFKNDEVLRQYSIGRLAIGERYSEMTEKWQRIMTADSKEVEAKYITPVYAALEKMVWE